MDHKPITNEGQIDADALRALAEQAAAQARIAGDLRTGISQSSSGIVVNVPIVDTFWARITGPPVNYVYPWIEQKEDGGGNLTDAPQGRTGGINNWPAYEAAVPRSNAAYTGKIVRLYAGINGSYYEFTPVGSSSAHGTFVTGISCGAGPGGLIVTTVTF